MPRLPRKTTWAHLLTRRERHVFVASPIDTATLVHRRPRTHTHTFLLKHIKYHKVPRLPRKTAWAHLLTHQERHVFVASPKDTPTLVPRWSRTDGCGHQKQGHANTCQPPDPQNVKREPFPTHSGKIGGGPLLLSMQHYPNSKGNISWRALRDLPSQPGLLKWSTWEQIGSILSPWSHLARSERGFRVGAWQGSILCASVAVQLESGLAPRALCPALQFLAAAKVWISCCLSWRQLA